jgi:hypothetical protein
MQVRAGQGKASLAALAEATRLAPDEPRFAYVLAVAEHDLDSPAAGLQRMQALARAKPGYRPAVETARAWQPDRNSATPPPQSKSHRLSAAAPLPTPATPSNE